MGSHATSLHRFTVPISTILLSPGSHLRKRHGQPPHSGGWGAEGGGVPLRKRIDLASRYWVEISSPLDPQGGDEVGNRRDGVIRKDVIVEVRMEAQHRGGVGNAPLGFDIRKVSCQLN